MRATSAEFKTARLSLGLSDSDVAALAGIKETRSVRRWEDPEDTSRNPPDQITQLLHALNYSVNEAAQQAADIWLANYRKIDATIDRKKIEQIAVNFCLIRYKEYSDLAECRPEYCTLPEARRIGCKIHQAVVERTLQFIQQAARREKIHDVILPRVVDYVRGDFMAWLKDRPNTEELRIAWANQKTEGAPYWRLGLNIGHDHIGWSIIKQKTALQ